MEAEAELPLGSSSGAEGSPPTVSQTSERPASGGTVSADAQSNGDPVMNGSVPSSSSDATDIDSGVTGSDSHIAAVDGSADADGEDQMDLDDPISGAAPAPDDGPSYVGDNCISTPLNTETNSPQMPDVEPDSDLKGDDATDTLHVPDELEHVDDGVSPDQSVVSSAAAVESVSASTAAAMDDNLDVDEPSPMDEDSPSADGSIVTDDVRSGVASSDDAAPADAVTASHDAMIITSSSTTDSQDGSSQQPSQTSAADTPETTSGECDTSDTQATSRVSSSGTFHANGNSVQILGDCSVSGAEAPESAVSGDSIVEPSLQDGLHGEALQRADTSENSSLPQQLDAAETTGLTAQEADLVELPVVGTTVSSTPVNANVILAAPSTNGSNVAIVSSSNAKSGGLSSFQHVSSSSEGEGAVSSSMPALNVRAVMNNVTATSVNSVASVDSNAPLSNNTSPLMNNSSSLTNSLSPLGNNLAAGDAADALTTLASAALNRQHSNEIRSDLEDDKPQNEEDIWYTVGIVKGTSFTVTDYLSDPNVDFSNLSLDDLPSLAGFHTTPLEPGTAYKFRVAAINSCGRGEFSEESAFKTCLPGFPGAPSAIKISKSAEGAHLSWEPPQVAADGIFEYSVYLAVRSSTPSKDAKSQLAFVRVYVGKVNMCVVTQKELSNAHIDSSTKPAIIFRIAARNNKGYGPATQVRWLQDMKSGGVKRPGDGRPPPGPSPSKLPKAMLH